MIRVRRTTEPVALARARTSRLPLASQIYSTYGAPSSRLADVLTGDDVAELKRTLFKDQRKKCAWCERRRDFSSSPIEHYRPKNGAWRNEPGESRRASPAHYWWLTWTWENLLFACARCNDAGHKANYFPLLADTPEMSSPSSPFLASIPTEIFDVSAERPALLDPTVDAFLDHARWTPTNTQHARALWTWSPTHLTERGRLTIKILKLDELTDEVSAHLVRHVLRGVKDVELHLRGRRTRQAAERWASVLAMLAPEENFTAATWCALQHWMPEPQRVAWELAPIPRPE